MPQIQATSNSKQARRYAARISRVLDFIEAHLDEALGVQRLSEVAAFSPFHFHRQFTAVTGISVSRLVALLRLKRASTQLVFNTQLSITHIALEAGFANAESFSRAFRKVHGQTPSGFRKHPQWQTWQVTAQYRATLEQMMKQANAAPYTVEYVDFPETLIAVLEHHGPEKLVYNTVKAFIDWRKTNAMPYDQGKTYVIYYTDPNITPSADFRMDIGVSVDLPVALNAAGVITKVIPKGRCAKVRHLGSRDYIPEAEWLYREWLPHSGEQCRDFPPFMHFINVGPTVESKDMITDVYLPLIGESQWPA